jgi:hypothetical protein
VDLEQTRTRTNWLSTEHYCMNSRGGASAPFGKDSPRFFQMEPNLSLGNPSHSKE